MIPLAFALEECPRYANLKDIPCRIQSSYTPSEGCIGQNITIYNSSGVNVQNMTWGSLLPSCNATFNITELGTFSYNSTVENGIINIQGEEEEMILVIALFLIGINLLVFALPFWVRFSKSEAAHYVVKYLMWIAAVILLWFNTTIFRQLASDWGLGIDNFLTGYWWIFTLLAISSIFLMVYIGLVGMLKLMKEAKLKERLGDDGY